MDEQCASASAWPEGSIFAATRAEHGHYVLAMWRGAQKLSQAQTATLTSLDTETVTKLYHTLRPAALDTTINLGGAEMLGGGDRVVVIDEARVARRKYRRGRAIPTHQTCIIGGAELEAVGEPEGGGQLQYAGTGRCFLAEIPGRTADTFRPQIGQRVDPGSTV